MCQYSSVDGRPTDWHFVHYGALARGGAGLVMAEATAISREGRITPADAGIWSDSLAADYMRINQFVHNQGAVSGIQLSHAGRKASSHVPWQGSGALEAPAAWQPVGPTAVEYPGYSRPRALTNSDLGRLVADWRDAAARAVEAGFDVIEIHAAHGYLLHQFLSPLTNDRHDEYGGSPQNRARLLHEVVEAVRGVMPDANPLFVRVSACDWIDGGLEPRDLIEVATHLRRQGVDLVDVSSGGLAPEQRVVTGPGYQVGFARAIRQGARIAVAAVGLITEARQADDILFRGAADAVLLARGLLRDPNWPQMAAAELGTTTYWPQPYMRAGYGQVAPLQVGVPIARSDTEGH